MDINNIGSVIELSRSKVDNLEWMSPGLLKIPINCDDGIVIMGFHCIPLYKEHYWIRKNFHIEEEGVLEIVKSSNSISNSGLFPLR